MTDTDHQAITTELRALRSLCRVIDKMPEGARGRAMRWLASKYEREMRECGMRGEQ
jgi:hypothetical protein